MNSLINGLLLGLLAGSLSLARARDATTISHVPDRNEDEPWSVHAVRIPRTNSSYSITSTLGEGDRIGLNTLTRQVRTLPKSLGKPVAAINGDFYKTENESYPGDPRGLHILRGEFVSSPNGKQCFWFDTNGNPVIGVVESKFVASWEGADPVPFGLNEEPEEDQAVLYSTAAGESTHTRSGADWILESMEAGQPIRLIPGKKVKVRLKEIQRRNAPLSPTTAVLHIPPPLIRQVAKPPPGTIVTLSMQTSPSLEGVQTGLGGGPALVLNGKLQPVNVPKSRDRHPRSAIGWNKDFIFLVVVDGRQPGLSMGMTLPELGRQMIKYGCTDAINLDGGGSTELWMNGKILNSPCYGHERSTANVLVVVQKP